MILFTLVDCSACTRIGKRLLLDFYYVYISLSKYTVLSINLNVNANVLLVVDYDERCDVTLILLEMDRILRPEGTVVFRDTVEMLTKIQSITNGMKWTSRIMDHEKGPFIPEKILLAVKSYWTGPSA